MLAAVADDAVPLMTPSKGSKVVAEPLDEEVELAVLVHVGEDVLNDVLAAGEMGADKVRVGSTRGVEGQNALNVSLGDDVGDRVADEVRGGIARVAVENLVRALEAAVELVGRVVVANDDLLAGLERWMGPAGVEAGGCTRRSSSDVRHDNVAIVGAGRRG